MKNQIRNFLSDFFSEYETQRQVLVRNRRVGVFCRLIQLGVLGYIIGWVFIYEKGYQSTDTAVSSVYTKMKGVGYTNRSGLEQIWDVADYVFPSMGGASFMVMTNFIITENQTIGKCPELPGKDNCTTNAECEEGRSKRPGNGHMTGLCLNQTGTCEVLAWCPVENDLTIPDPPLLMSAENFTLYIKNSITFPLFNVTRSNRVEGIDNKYISECFYHPDDAPLCPIMRLGDIVKFAGFNFDFTTIAKVGGSIGILVDWTCNLDWSLRHCKPVYTFHGLYGNPGVSMGNNFRYAKHFREGGQAKRTLIKVFGIRIDIIVQSLARKFDIIPTMTAIGSGVGIFGVATVVCDLVLLYLLPKKELYKTLKYKYPATRQKDVDFEEDGTDMEADTIEKKAASQVKSHSSSFSNVQE